MTRWDQPVIIGSTEWQSNRIRSPQTPQGTKSHSAVGVPTSAHLSPSFRGQCPEWCPSSNTVMVVSMALELDHEHPHAEGHQDQRHQEASAGVLKLDPCHSPKQNYFPSQEKKKVWVPNTSLKFWSPIIGLGWGCYAHHQAVLWPQLGVLQVNLILTLCLDAGQKPVCRSRSNSWNGTWNNGVVPNCESSMSRLHTVTCLFNFYAEYNMWYARLDGIKIAGRNNNLRYADDMTLMAENKEGLRSLLMRMKEESENADLKLNI